MRSDKQDTGQRTVRVRITGTVQGVCYRAWTQSTAMSLGLSGWVRNRRDGAVEALFSGAADRVSEMLRRCYAGPPAAEVKEVVQRLLDFFDGGPAEVESCKEI